MFILYVNSRFKSNNFSYNKWSWLKVNKVYIFKSLRMIYVQINSVVMPGDGFISFNNRAN